MLTKLEALNRMLAAVGQRRVTSTSSLHPAALQANDTLISVNKRIQQDGYDFNRILFTLQPQVSGEVVLPNDYLEVDPVDTSSKLTVRKGKMFDPINNTFILSRSVDVIMTILLDLEDLPHSAAEYIADLSTQFHYSDKKGDAEGLQPLRERTLQSLTLFQKSRARNNDWNALHSPQAQKLLAGISGAGNLRFGKNPNTIGG